MATQERDVFISITGRTVSRPSWRSEADLLFSLPTGCFRQKLDKGSKRARSKPSPRSEKWRNSYLNPDNAAFSLVTLEHCGSIANYANLTFGLEQLSLNPLNSNTSLEIFSGEYEKTWRQMPDSIGNINIPNF